MTRKFADWVAVDWGTSNMRAWIIGRSGNIIAQTRSDKGMGRLAPEQFEPALLDLIGDHLSTEGTTPIICCGMVGARQGWIEAAYAPVPCHPPGIDAATRAPASDPRLDVRILPGVSQDSPADVMRGEETQIAGYLARHPEFDGVLCLPGTHTKWAHVSAGEIVSFRTFMTGELFALLSVRSILRHGPAGTGWDAAAFAAALGDAMSRPQTFAADLFSLRAGGLLHGLTPARARARLSGLLIGLELAGARPYWLGRAIILIGSPTLSRLYHSALVQQGVAARIANGGEITLAGLGAAHEAMRKSDR